MNYPIVKVAGCDLAENTHSHNEKVWNVANLIERAKDLQPFDLPLAAVYSGCSVWDAVTSPYEMAKHMRRVLDVDISKPVILDQEGFIMDGWHRVVRALIDGRTTIPAVRFEVTPPHDFTKAQA